MVDVGSSLLFFSLFNEEFNEDLGEDSELQSEVEGAESRGSIGSPGGGIGSPGGVPSSPGGAALTSAELLRRLLDRGARAGKPTYAVTK